MNILLTGATGFVGRQLGPVLAETHQVFGASRSLTAEIPEGIQRVRLDADGIPIEACPHFDAVIHLAARVHITREHAVDSYAAFRDANVRMTSNLAKWAAENRTKRFIFLSSVKVNGEQSRADHPFAFDDVPAPEDAYGRSKLEAEQALRSICADTGMEFVVIRPPLVYGPGVGGNFRTLLHWVKRGFPLPLGRTGNRRSLIALENLVDLIKTCLTHPAAANQIFMAADGEDVSTTELLLKIAHAHGQPPRLLPVPEGWLRKCAAMLGMTAAADRLLGSLTVDASRTRTVLGWVPVISMDEQLRKIVRDDPRS